MVVRGEIHVIVAVLGELVVGVDGNDVFTHSVVSRLYILVLRLGIRAVVGICKPVGKSELGVVGSYKRIGLYRSSETVSRLVHKLGVPLRHNVGTEEQLKRLLVPHIQSAVVHTG